MGQPLMPWQRLVADVGGEIDPETGLPAYREVVFTVPRQSGKTTLVLAWEVQRARGWRRLGPQRISYSAQTGNDARKKLVEDQLPILRPRMARLGIARVLTGMGNEAVVFKNGSRIVLMASAEDSGHGKTVDLGIEDELFADVDHRRDQALLPAMATRAYAQMVKTSTMGTDASLPWNETVARGRAAVAAGQRSGIAYFEWSADEDDGLDDPATWWSFMPALGHTQTVQAIGHAKETMKPGEFRRAFGNLTTRSDERLIPASSWAAVCSEAARPGEPLTFALDVNPERSSGSIAVASPGPVAELVDWREGAGWLVERARGLSERWGGPWFVVSKTGPAASLVPDLEAAGVRVRQASAQEEVQACGRLYDAVMGGRIEVRPSARLDSAVAAAAKRQSGDAWAWGRKGTAVDISPLVAITLAVWGAATIQPGGRVPMAAWR